MRELISCCKKDQVLADEFRTRLKGDNFEQILNHPNKKTLLNHLGYSESIRKVDGALEILFYPGLWPLWHIFYGKSSESSPRCICVS